MSGKERRRHRRYKTSESCFAALKAGAITVGRIRDISMGGLSFEYLDNEDASQEEGHEGRVDLFVAGGGGFIREIPCQTVRDCQPMRDAPSFSGIGVRLRSLRFETMTEQASHQVEAYIFQCAQV